MSTDLHEKTPGGVEHTGMIDMLSVEEGKVVMVMVERRPWDGSFDRLFQLQEKFNAYLSFALDGEMLEHYPMLADKPIRIRLDTLSSPDPETVNLLGLIRDQISFQQIDLEVRVYGTSGCGGDCSCHCG